MNHQHSPMRQTTASTLITKQRSHWISFCIAVICFGYLGVAKLFHIELSQDEFGWSFFIGIAAAIVAIFTAND